MSYTIVPFEPVLVDTNILIYAFDRKQGVKHQRASDYLLSRFEEGHEVVISTQVINEFISVGLKVGMRAEEIEANLADLIDLKSVRVIETTQGCSTAALAMSRRFRMSYWDALIAQTMFENNVFTICTEDPGFKNDPRIGVVNPLE